MKQNCVTAEKVTVCALLGTEAVCVLSHVTDTLTGPTATKDVPVSGGMPETVTLLQDSVTASQDTWETHASRYTMSLPVILPHNFLSMPVIVQFFGILTWSS